MNILTYFYSIILCFVVNFYVIGCGYKTDPYWIEPEKQDLLLP